MGDISGARIVVPSLDLQDVTTEFVSTVFVANSPAIKDQRAEGDDYGYRAIHVLIRVQGRLAEIQIRTEWQDRWAQVVESLDSARDFDLKHGQGPTDWLEWLLELSDEFRKADLGEPYTIPPTPHDRFIRDE
jgi:ppGpp synthetase/RelA/SpoT-type nucleotidyltranferase